MSDPSRARAASAAQSNGDAPARVAVLAGGVGAARFLRGVVRAMPSERVTAIVNTGDDRLFYGVHVSPDLDIVSYTLAGRVDPERGFGLAGDRFTLVERLAALGHETWFRLGDADFAFCLHRSLRLAEGAGLDEVADELRREQGLALRILPMSNDPCPTFIELSDRRRVHFEEYLVRDGASSEVRGVDLSAAATARPAPGVVAAIEAAELVLVCPSNPVVSIGPILAVPGIRAALDCARAPVVAVSPIIGDAPVKGPATPLLRALGVEVSAVGVAHFYRDWIDGFVCDERDRERLPEIEALGLRARALDTLMVEPAVAERVARAAFELGRSLR